MISVQSPIEIALRDARMDDNVLPLEFYGYWNGGNGRAIIENTGTATKVTFHNQKTQAYICGGILPPNERYIFENLHFHWGKRDNIGCEHKINGKRYAMEAHLVHFNSKYGNLQTAVTKADGVVVLAFFIQPFGDTPCKLFGKIADKVKCIREYKSKCEIDSDCLLWMASQELNKHYYTYHGSLTTAPYTECVTWIIYQTPVFVSKQQVASFRELYANEGEKIQRNYRSIQMTPPDEVPLVVFTRNIRLRSKL